MAPVRIDRSNSPFTEEEKIWIILEYGEMSFISVVKEKHPVDTTI